jgi:hypothetical protein
MGSLGQSRFRRRPRQPESSMLLSDCVVGEESHLLPHFRAQAPNLVDQPKNRSSVQHDSSNRSRTRVSTRISARPPDGRSLHPAPGPSLSLLPRQGTGSGWLAMEGVDRHLSVELRAARTGLLSGRDVGSKMQEEIRTSWRRSAAVEFRNLDGTSQVDVRRLAVTPRAESHQNCPLQPSSSERSGS